MKRGAERQLSRNGDVEDELQDETSDLTRGFKKADESVLARRPIRSMPKRSLGGVSSSSSSSSSEKAPTPQKFSGFPGFGTANFTFTPPSTPPSGTNTSSSNSLLSPPSIVSPTSSAATKTFASFLSNSTSNPESTATGTNNEAALNYFLSLRGLNVSFIGAITKAVEADPFADAGEFLERYRDLRSNIEIDFTEKSAGSDVSKPTPTPSFGFSAPNAPPKPSVSMPVPPPSFSGFGATSTTSTSTNKPTGFLFPSTAPKAEGLGALKAPAFTFPSTAPKVDAPKPSAFTFPSTAPKADAPKPPSFTFPSATSTSSSTTLPSSPPKPSPLFGSPSFGSSSTSPPGTLFGGSTTTPLSTSIFGSTPSKATTTTPFGFGFTQPKTAEGSKPPSVPAFTFGASSTSTSTSTTTSTADVTSKPNPFGSFGKTSGSLGNPVGFVFGTPPPTAKPSDGDDEAEGTEATSSAKTPAFMGKTPGGTPSGASTPVEGTPDVEDAEDPARFQPATTVHDVEGEGEEDEEMTYSVRAKVFKMVKTDDRQSWADMGIGMLKLKKHKETDSRRVLLRNTSTGKIVINFKVYAGLQAKRQSKYISFVGHDNGESITFRLRFKTEADAEALKVALEKDIEAVVAKSE